MTQPKPADYNPDMTPQDERMERIALALERIADVLESVTEEDGESVRVHVDDTVMTAET